MQDEYFLMIEEPTPFKYLIDINKSVWFIDFAKKHPNKLIYK